MAILYTESENEHGHVMVSVLDSSTGWTLPPTWASPEYQTELAAWLVDCGAHLHWDGRIRYNAVTQYEVPDGAPHPPVQHDDEYDAWIDERWLEIQDEQALRDDALGRW